MLIANLWWNSWQPMLNADNSANRSLAGILDVNLAKFCEFGQELSQKMCFFSGRPCAHKHKFTGDQPGNQLIRGLRPMIGAPLPN